MKPLNIIIATILLLAFIFPLLVDARAGADYRGGSYGRSSSSFGRSQGYQGGGYNYRPRSTYQSPYTTPNYSRSTSTPYNYQNKSSSGFLPGLISGVAGSYLYNKIFNSDNTANQPATSTNAQKTEKQGSFLPILLLLVVIFLAWRFFKKQKSKQNNPEQSSNQAGPWLRGKTLSDLMGTSQREAAPIQLSESDFATFQNILINIQNAWSSYDLEKLRHFSTPEMFQNLAQIIQENQERHIKNFISNVNLLNQEPQDVWQESNATLAKVALTWNAIDYAANTSIPEKTPGYLIDGNMNEPSVTTEIWTFKREYNGPWLLAGID